MNKTRTRTRQTKSTRSSKSKQEKRGWGGMFLFLTVAAITAAAVTYFSGGFKIPFSVAFSDEPENILSGGGTPELPAAPTNNLTTYQDDGTPFLIGNLSDGWVVEPISDVKANVGPLELAGGSPLQFVTPAYQVVPDNINAGAYVLEPNSDSGDLIDVLKKFEQETEKTISDAKTIFSSLEKLEKLLIEANLPIDESSQSEQSPLKNDLQNQ